MDNADKIFCLERISILERHRKQLAEEIQLFPCQGLEQEYQGLLKAYSAVEEVLFNAVGAEAKFLLGIKVEV